MKKFFLSAGVVVLFFLYGLHQQQEAQDAQVVIPEQPTPTDDGYTAHPTQGTAGSSPTSQNAAGSANPPTPTTSNQRGQYKDGTYTGDAIDAFYGNIQVEATIQGGKITNVTFLQYPNDRGTSIMINQQAMPYLKQEAIQAQNANVDIVSGATDTSMAFRQSLASALTSAH